ncbi:hypothetical protein CMI37_05210 [Candidatus Pacearchaeota archaeon]|jgi:hypothetical protein|nr:hypothetical protein [Candidatus Pacearchaeota archaeon]|tara:strand:- start:457 stop:663 length:207 start_codon:yes stop_codon:yes gene_type:complete
MFGEMFDFGESKIHTKVAIILLYKKLFTKRLAPSEEKHLKELVNNFKKDLENYNKNVDSLNKKFEEQK